MVLILLACLAASALVVLLGATAPSPGGADDPSPHPHAVDGYGADRVTGAANTAPDPPTLVAPPDGALAVSLGPELRVTVTDADTNTLDVTFYGRDASDPLPGDDFILIALPDTQYYSQSYPSFFVDQTTWVVANKDLLNIVYVAHEGDLVQNPGAHAEWAVADGAMAILEDPVTTGLPDGIPFGVLPGNHDTPTGLYNQYFGDFRFLGRGYYGGRYLPGNNDNNYTLFSASGLDFVIVNLGWDSSPDAAVLEWADDVLHTYEDRRAIVVSHYIMEIGEGASFSSQGLAIYNALRGNENLFLMLCGHRHGEGIRIDVDGFTGHTITTLLADYQDLPNGGNGWLRILEFSPANDVIRVKTYSPSLDAFGTDLVMGVDTTSAPFTLDYTMSGSAAFRAIGTVTGVAPGDDAFRTWSGRSPGVPYEWYVEVSDGVDTTTGPTWSFTTACSTNGDCDDGNPCTDDLCVRNGVCENTPNADSCDDGVDCTQGDVCSNGICRSGTPSHAACDDLDVCTDDTCNQETGCEYAFNIAPCDDGIDCTSADVCADGVCAGTDDCPQGEICNRVNGQCMPPPPFLAYNDCVYDASLDNTATDPNGQSVHYIGANVTVLGVGNGFGGASSGELLDYTTGTGTGITATLAQGGGVNWQPSVGGGWTGGYDTAPGTDARDTFGGIADMTGVIYYGSLGWWVDVTIAGLEPTKRYTFATSASRANANYSDRWTIYTISGVDASSNGSTLGTQEYLGNPQAVWFNTGDNHDEGYVARWRNIAPGLDGSITVRAQAHPNSNSGGRKAYSFDVFLLQEQEPECELNSHCDDGDFCNGQETCNTSGFCDPGTPIVCDDGVGCTVDACDEVNNQCEYVPNSGLCDDGLYCNGAETCDPVLDCRPGAEPCPAGQWCHEATEACVDDGTGDFDVDGDVDLADFATFQVCFGPLDPGPCQAGNTNGDNTINLADYAAFATALEASGPR
jgi:hypothetical protein